MANVINLFYHYAKLQSERLQICARFDIFKDICFWKNVLRIQWDGVFKV